MDGGRQSLLAFLKGQLHWVIDIQTDLIFISLKTTLYRRREKKPGRTWKMKWRDVRTGKKQVSFRRRIWWKNHWMCDWDSLSVCVCVYACACALIHQLWQLCVYVCGIHYMNIQSVRTTRYHYDVMELLSSLSYTVVIEKYPLFLITHVWHITDGSFNFSLKINYGWKFKSNQVKMLIQVQ